MSELYKVRQAKLFTDLQTEKVTIGLIMSPTNIYYYTGFLADPHERFMVLLLDTKTEQTILYVPTLDLQLAKEVADVDQVITVSDVENGYEKMATLFDGPITSLGFEKNYLTVFQYEELRNVCQATDYVNMEQFILEARKRKTKAEINFVKQAIKITEEGLQKVITQIKVGMTELQVKALLEYELTILGAEGLAFDTTILTGKNSALPHGVSGQNIIEHGDFLLMDFGVYVNGYCSDITRTFVVGEPSAKQIEIYDAVLAANEAAITQVNIHNPLKAIDLAARNVIEEKGYGEYFTHRVGHGLGLEVHEYPSIHSENDAAITTGLLFTIEPGIYVAGLGGVRIEDDLYVNEAGNVEVLTSYPKTLTVIA